MQTPVIEANEENEFYELKFPENWVSYYSHGGIAHSPKSSTINKDKFQYNYIEVYRDTTNIKLEENVENRIKYYETNYLGSLKESIAKTTFGKTYIITANIESAMGPFSHLYYIFKDNEVVYTLTFVAYKDIFDQYLAEAKSIFSTFRVK